MKIKTFSIANVKILLLVYVLVILWWFSIFLRDIHETTENYLFSLIYSVMPLGGGIIGFINARHWGGFASSIGRAVLFISGGIFAWGIGNLIFGYYNLILGVPIPYPSIADAAFFLIYPFSAIGVISFFRVTGASFALRRVSGKLLLLLIPIFLIFLSYYLLFIVARGGIITYDGGLLKLFLDIVYPVGDVVVITFASILYSLSFKFLGGTFRKPIIFIIIGFISTYIADFLFSYTTTVGTYFVGKWVDIFYPTAFLFIALGLSLLSPEFLDQSD